MAERRGEGPAVGRDLDPAPDRDRDQPPGGLADDAVGGGFYAAHDDTGAYTGTPPAALDATHAAPDQAAWPGVSHRVDPDAYSERERAYLARPVDEKSPAEIERDIRRTRAEMTETVDAIERKLSPDRLKHELKESMHEGIDYLRDRFDPRRIAKQTGRSMLDTIKENPLPSLIAGLSVGWLLMRSTDHGPDRYEGDDYDGYGRGYARGGAGYRSYARGGYYPEAYYPGTPPYGRAGYYKGAYRERRYEDHEGDGGHASLRDRMGERTGEVRERVSETAGELRHRAGELGHEVQHRMHDWGHQARYRTRRTVSGLEQFVHDNPLAAAAIAAGVGAILGTLLPSTEQENALMGETRDRLVHRARDVAEQTVEHSKPIAQRVTDEVREAVREVADTARQQMEHVKETAREGARDVTEEARQELRQRT